MPMRKEDTEFKLRVMILLWVVLYGAFSMLVLFNI